jgi:hypothetical protein
MPLYFLCRHACYVVSQIHLKVRDLRFRRAVNDVKQSKKTVEEGTDGLPEKSTSNYQSTLGTIPEQPISHFKVHIFPHNSNMKYVYLRVMFSPLKIQLQFFCIPA